MFGKPFPDEAQQQRICQIYFDGGRLQDVASEMGYCITTISRVLEQNGLKARKRGTRKGTGPVYNLDDGEMDAFKTNWDKLDSTIKGTIAEEHVKTNLAERGFDVWEPFCQNHCTDLFILHGRSIMRIQVKSATYDRKTKAFRANVTRHRRNGRTTGYTPEDTDFFIIYCGGLAKPEFYVIPAALMIGRTDAKLYPNRARQFSIGGPDWEEFRNAFHLLGATYA